MQPKEEKIHYRCGLPYSEHITVGINRYCPDDTYAQKFVYTPPEEEPEPSIAALFDDPEAVDDD